MIRNLVDTIWKDMKRAKPHLGEGPWNVKISMDGKRFNTKDINRSPGVVPVDYMGKKRRSKKLSWSVACPPRRHEIVAASGGRTDVVLWT